MAKKQRHKPGPYTKPIAVQAGILEQLAELLCAADDRAMDELARLRTVVADAGGGECFDATDTLESLREIFK